MAELSKEPHRLIALLERLRIKDSQAIYDAAISRLLHDINTPLNVVLGRAQLLQEDERFRENPSAHLEAILRQARRMSDISHAFAAALSATKSQARILPQDILLQDVVVMVGDVVEHHSDKVQFGARAEDGLWSEKIENAEALIQICSHIVLHAVEKSLPDNPTHVHYQIMPAVTARGMTQLIITVDYQEDQSGPLTNAGAQADTGPPVTSLRWQIAEHVARRNGGYLKTVATEGRVQLTASMPLRPVAH